MEAVRLVNERLGAAELGISDGIVGAVACITNYESSNENAWSIDTHLKGLVRMVEMRGGVLKGGFPEYLKCLIAGSDHNSAIALARTLTFPSMEEWNTKLSPIASSRKLSDTTRVRECSNISKDSEVFAEKTDAIFTRLRTLCRLASSPTFSANVSVMDNAIYSDQVYLVAKEITSITNTPITSKNTAHHYVVLHCSAHHCRKVSPWWELHSSIMTQTLSRLRSSIEGVRLDIPEENQESIDTKAIIRALSVGVIASVERPVGLWFHQYVTELSNRLGLKRLDELRCILEDVLWPDGWNLPDIELRDGEETQIVEQGIKRTGR